MWGGAGLRGRALGFHRMGAAYAASGAAAFIVPRTRAAQNYYCFSIFLFLPYGWSCPLSPNSLFELLGNVAGVCPARRSCVPLQIDFWLKLTWQILAMLLGHKQYRLKIIKRLSLFNFFSRRNPLFYCKYFSSYRIEVVANGYPLKMA